MHMNRIPSNEKESALLASFGYVLKPLHTNNSSAELKICSNAPELSACAWWSLVYLARCGNSARHGPQKLGGGAGSAMRRCGDGADWLGVCVRTGAELYSEPSSQRCHRRCGEQIRLAGLTVKCSEGRIFTSGELGVEDEDAGEARTSKAAPCPP